MKQTVKDLSDLISYFAKHYDEQIPRNKRTKTIVRLQAVFKQIEYNHNYLKDHTKLLEFCMLRISQAISELSCDNYEARCCTYNKHIIELLSTCLANLTREVSIWVTF